ncbi:MAG: hypothetical protein ACTSVI_01840 [Promethearchaeota archaeon]
MKKKTLSSNIKRFLNGDITKNELLTLVIPFILLSLGVSLLIANLLFPTAYDWRYMVISSLLDRDDNPLGYMIPSIGMTLAGLGMIPMVGYFHKRLNVIAKGPARTGTLFLIISIIGLISIGTIGQAITSIHKFHELLALFAFLGLLLTAGFYWFPIRKDHRKGEGKINFKLVVIGGILIWIAFIGMIVSFAGVELIDNDWGWVGLDWIDKGAPVVFSFALWEWILFLSQMTYLVLLSLSIPG